MITNFKIFELVDDSYVSDYDDIYDKSEYEGNLYLYSDKPLKKDDVDFDYERLRIFNRANASDTTSEYIYQIKTKNPLYRRTMSFVFFDDEKAIDESKYSGYFYKDSIFCEWFARVKSEDVISFRYIGGFVKYDKHNPEKLNIELSEETDRWLYNYIGEGSLRLGKLTNDIIEELKPFRTNKKLRIFKGIEEVQIKHFSEEYPPYKKGQTIVSNFSMATSWSTNILIARRFVDDYPSSPPFVIMMEVEPEDVLVDVQKLPTQYYHTNQREIIVLPGEYEYKIVWQGEV